MGSLQGDVKQGLVYTNDKCKGCNRCISACPVMGANYAVQDNGANKVLVNGDACVACGACIDACRHKARGYSDDTEAFLEALKNKERISLLVAPAFIANYPGQYRKILGYLKSLGANRIISVSFGADITTWGYLNYLSRSGLQGGISQPCPAIVDYIERYIPQLVDKLVPVHSPLMCAAIYAKKYAGITDKFAFISPCIAKKSEIMRNENRNYIQYNVTFQHLMDKLPVKELGRYDAGDEIEYGLGSIYPQPGGLKENVEHFLGKDVMVRQIEGEKHAYHFLENYAYRVSQHKKLPFLVDALNCSGGCIYGTATEPEKQADDDALFEIHEQKVKSRSKAKKSPWSEKADYAGRLRNFNRRFRELKLEDFMCTYQKNASRRLPDVPDSEINRIFLQELEKDTKEKQSIDCGACGYDSCRRMAEAICHGLNSRENCVHYVKEQLGHEREAIGQKNEEIRREQEEKQALYTEIVKEFEQIRSYMAELTMGNQSSASDTTEMAAAISGMGEFAEKLQRSMTEVAEAVEGYNAINSSIIEISGQTSMLALNTGIEAARTGEAGKGFTVIANRVRDLAEQTKETVISGKEHSDIIIPAIEALNQEAVKFVEVIHNINERTSALAAGSEEIAAQTELVLQSVNKIAGKMQESIMK